MVKPNTLTFVSGLLLAGMTGVAVHWYDRAQRATDAISYMVEQDEELEQIVEQWKEGM